MRPNAVEQAAIEFLSHGGSGTKSGQALRAAVDAKFPGAVERAKERREKAFDKNRIKGAPDWARRMFLKYAPRRAELIWRRTSVTRLRGTCDGFYKVTVTERIGTPEEKLRILLLHEIAHFVGVGHDERWTEEFKRLLVANGLYRAALKSGLTGQSKLRRIGRRRRAA